MSGVRTYDPRNVQIIVGGNPLSGYADGSFVTVTPDETLYSKTVGADGEVSRARSNNRTATITLTLKQTSQSNDVLSALALADNAANAGVVPIMIKEIGSGSTLIFAQSAWVEDFPDTDYSKEVGERAWTIATAQTDMFVGGNSFNNVG